MKKILLAALVLLCSFTIFAQDKEPKNIKLGLTAYPNIGWIKSDIQDVKSDGARVGFTYGLLSDFYFTENYAFSTGLQLTSINGKTEEILIGPADEPLPANVKYKLQYLEIPAKIKLSTPERNAIKFYGEFGIGNAFNIRAKKDIDLTNGTIYQQKTDIYDDIYFYRASMIIGAGIAYNIGENTNLAGGLTFNNGFTDIRKGSGTLKNSYLSFNLALFF
jgi:long-subunit fatty acid transport protein